MLFFPPVSVSDVEAIREGHQSEVLLSIADEFPADRCFTLVFRSRRGNLDLVAESAEEAQSWIRGIRKLLENLEKMGAREKLDQYLLLQLSSWTDQCLQQVKCLVGQIGWGRFLMYHNQMDQRLVQESRQKQWWPDELQRSARFTEDDECRHEWAPCSSSFYSKTL